MTSGDQLTMYDVSTRARVALVTCEALPNLYVDDHLLVSALGALGIEAVPAVWSRAEINWAAFDAIVMRSPWDYFERVEEFRRWLTARIATGAPLCNAAQILEWNFDKGYLQDLARHGVELVPTLCIAQHERPDIAKLVAERGWDEIVVKPTISGGAYRTHRLRSAALPSHLDEIYSTLQSRGVLVQPFVPEVLRSGELSLLFFDGELSHAVRKRPAAGDYRVQVQFGGTAETVAVSDELIAQASSCLAHMPAASVYARVDGLEKDGRFLLMELEAFEPLMFLAHHPDAAARFARAIQRRLQS
jgi:glutathione synthase/RimK-type ligase-like ATP-grasp enzyme